MKRIFVIFVPMFLAACVPLFLEGCGLNNPLNLNQFPIELNYAPKPLTILVVNDAGVVFKDASGAIYTYTAGYAFTAPFIRGSKKGDVLP